jgi:hypothetical protein
MTSWLCISASSFSVEKENVLVEVRSFANSDNISCCFNKLSASAIAVSWLRVSSHAFLIITERCSCVTLPCWFGDLMCPSSHLHVLLFNQRLYVVCVMVAVH